MADGTELNVGSGGDTISTDDLGSVKVQRVKVQYGTDGNATDVSDDNPMPIDDAGGSLTVDGSVTANAGTNLNTSALALEAGGNLAGAATSLAVVDDWDESDRAKVNIIVGQAGIAGGTGTDGATVPRVTLATNVALPAGTNAIGKLAANSGVDIGDVDVTSVPAPLSTTGGGTEATALRVTVATDSTGVLSVDDNGSSLTVDYATTGSGTATGALRVELPTNGTGVIATVGAVTAITNALPAGTNAIGKLAANSGVDIGDVDVTSISAGNNLIGNVGLSGARTAGGTTYYKNLDVDETEDDVKASAGQVYWIHAFNLANAKRYLKFYDLAAASVSVGTTVPVLTFPLPTQGDTNGAGFTLSIPNGIAFGTAICIAATTGVADNDTGAPGANEVIVNLGYA